MIPTNIKLVAAGTFGAGMFAVSAASAQPDRVGPWEVTGGHPASITVSIKDKDARRVRRDVDAASTTSGTSSA